MKNIEISEVYTLFEEISELVKAGNKSNAAIQTIQPEIELPDLSAIGELSGKLDETLQEIRKPGKVEHHHIFSIASSKIFYGVIGLCIVCLFLLFTAFYQRKEIAIYKDNDLKYRYIQMQGEITPAGVIALDSIFENRRDSIRMISKQVKQHEMAVIGKAKRLEKAHLKEQEAERLKEEAENLGHGR